MVVVFYIGALAIALPGCESCHIEKDGTSTADKTGGAPPVAQDHSVHASVKCVKCHVGSGFSQRVSYGARMGFEMIIPIVHQNNFDANSNYSTQCVACHKVQGVVVNNGIKINHTKCVTDANCIDCHGKVAHQANAGAVTTTYSMDGCYTCHSGIARTEGCSLCHADKDGQKRQSSTAWKVTHGVNWRQTHGMGDLNTCKTCHASAMCAKCHGSDVPHEKGFLALHGKASQSKAARCYTCHKQAFCTDCHGFVMPHPKGFVKVHDKVAKDDTDARCLKCHDAKDCSGCHAAHVHPGGSIGTLGGGKN